MVDAISGVDHHSFFTSRQDIDTPPAGHLEAEKGDLVGDRDLLDVSIEIHTSCGSHRPPCQEHAVKDLPGIVPPVHQFLCNMVGVGKKREQERIFRFTDQLTDLLGKSHIEDCIVEMFPHRIVFEDLELIT